MDIRELKRRIDLNDLAERLGLEKPKGQPNYRSPHHKDTNPSLSIWDGRDGQKWKDHSADQGGDHLDLVMYVEGILDTADALRRLHEIYGFAVDKPERSGEPRRERTRTEFIADQCLKEAAGAFEYLQGRGLPREVLDLAVKSKALGCNTWTKPNGAPGESGYGGPAAAFIVCDWSTGLAVAVDMRYIDAEANGGVKTQTQGEKTGHAWWLSRRHVERARTVYIVESAINALFVEACGMPYTAAIAIRGTGNAANLDLSMLRGKQVILALDADKPDEKGRKPGPEAAWTLYERLTAHDIACQMVDQLRWYEAGHNDVADVGKAEGIDELRSWLQRLEPWAIPGLIGKEGPAGRQRVHLPGHDWGVYWRFRCKSDFTTYVAKFKQVDEGDDEDGGGDKIEKMEDVCGFRVAGVSRVTIQSATATMSGESDAQPHTVFAVSVQVPRHGPKLLRRVLDDDRLHNVDQWKKLGPIFSAARFSRLLNIMERTADCGARDAVNFVGLCWRDGSPSVNEGPDCYFAEPDKQCPYSGLLFPSGPLDAARTVLQAYQGTFRENAALQLLVWALGAHLKAYLGFWPHCVLQADKGSGKSTLVKRLERSIAMTMFGGQSLQTEFRLLTSVSHTSHPVGWEELSARKQEIIDKAVAMLQECYQFTVTRRGSEMTEYLQCAPVLLAGEDVPVKSLTGKVVRTTLTGRMGPEMPDNLARFPVREWLQHLATLSREKVTKLRADVEAKLWEGCRGKKTDTGARRMVVNYSALGTAWLLLADFAGLARETGNFLGDMRAEMNAHIAETTSEREPWVWIMETLVSEIESRQFNHPFGFDRLDDKLVLVVRPQHVMDHIATSHRLRDFWNGLPVKSARVLKRQLQQHGVIVREELDRRIGGRRHAHLCALGLDVLADYGVFLSVPVDAQGIPELTAYSEGAP